MQVESLDHFKSVVAHQFFVAPADSDYLIARWLLLNGFEPELFWHASQAVEKYLKASLVLNEQEVRSRQSNGHDLCRLYEKHVQVFGDLALTRFERPQGLNAALWRDQPVSELIARLTLLGSPDSRYGLMSWHRLPDDLFKMDQLCWALRRLTIGLEWRVGHGMPCDASMVRHEGETYRNALRQDRTATPRGPVAGTECRLYPTGDSRSDLLHSWNFSYRRCPADTFQPAPPPVAPRIGPFANSYITLFWEILTEVDKNGALRPLKPFVESGLRWLVEMIKLPPEVREAFEAQLAEPRGA